MTHAWATIEEIAKLHGWSISYTRKLASIHQWRRRGRAPRQYDMLDAARRLRSDDRHSA